MVAVPWPVRASCSYTRAPWKAPVADRRAATVSVLVTTTSPASAANAGEPAVPTSRGTRISAAVAVVVVRRTSGLRLGVEGTGGGQASARGRVRAGARGLADLRLGGCEQLGVGGGGFGGALLLAVLHDDDAEQRRRQEAGAGGDQDGRRGRGRRGGERGRVGGVGRLVGAGHRGGTEQRGPQRQPAARGAGDGEARQHDD